MNKKIAKPTNNDVAWEQLFEDHAILSAISETGFFEIDSLAINKYRESRLMANFEHHANLPKIFKEYDLSILPISRNRYIMGHFDTYFKVNYQPDVEITSFEFPSSIQRINDTNLYSENSALSCAFNTGIIQDLLNNEETFYTVAGRMSTGSFSFGINNKNNTDNSPYHISVNNSQCEIDAGFESESYFLLVEAKLYDVEDFLIRQLYYPYRLWSSKISKKIIPAFMTYSNLNNKFSFFLYEFENILNYNSLRLIAQKDYIIEPENIKRIDILSAFSRITPIAEPIDIPFPQADKFERVVDLLTLLLDRELTKNEIASKYQFDLRQVDYYTNAAKYLGLVDNFFDLSTKEKTFRLTGEGKNLLNQKSKTKILSLIRKILDHEVFYKTFEFTLKNEKVPNNQETCTIISSCNLGISSSTIDRRATTVRRWIEWIWSLFND
ncbi:MAG: translation elongation factor [Nostocaceae cyanobacterium]|nr:translation elongation factor [Nostocaceae cyanobacterium]